MSRWRPPAAPSTAYITPAGYRMLEREMKTLWAKRRIVNDALAAAAAEGDRSENAEYIYRKKEQAGLDRRIRYLQKRMPNLKVVDQVGNHAQIFFGATVTLAIINQHADTQQVTHRQVTYRIVGPDETNLQHGDISIDSPLAKGLLKKRVDDQVTITSPGAQTHYQVLSIDY